MSEVAKVKQVEAPKPRRKGVPWWQQVIEDAVVGFATDVLKNGLKRVAFLAMDYTSASWHASQRTAPEVYNALYKWGADNGMFRLSARHRVMEKVYDDTDRSETVAKVNDGMYRIIKDGCIVSLLLAVSESKSAWGHPVNDKYIVLRIWGKPGSPMEQSAAAAVTAVSTDKRIRVYDADNPWRTHPRELRDLDSIVLSPTERARIIHHLDWWKTSRPMHDQYGLAYKTTFLLHGPPGTGKTTLAQAIAKHLEFDLSILKIDPAKMAELKDKIQQTRRKTVLLIEDVDRAVVGSPAPIPETTKVTVKGADGLYKFEGALVNAVPTTPAPPTERPIPGIEHLMNALDGVMSPEEVVVIMTTNHRDRLDPALIRPGRVNIEVLLDLFNWDRAAEMATLFGVPHDTVFAWGEPVWSVPSELQQRLMQELIRSSGGQ